METARNSKSNEKLMRENNMIFVKYQNIKTHLWLYLFIVIDWITGPVKSKESSYTTGIGLS